MTENEHGSSGESSTPKDSEAKLVWGEVFSALFGVSVKTGIPSNVVEWKNDDDKPLVLSDGEYSMNIKPLILAPGGHPMVVVANIYREGVHIELCGIMAFWEEDAPIIVIASASPVGKDVVPRFTSLEIAQFARDIVEAPTQLEIRSGAFPHIMGVRQQTDRVS